MDKDWATSPPTSMACIRWSQPSTTSFGQDTIPVGYIPKRSHGWKPNIDPFSPNHQTTPSESPWLWVHLPFISWVQVCGALAPNSTIFCFGLLSFPCRFCRSRLALFHSSVSLSYFFMCFVMCLSFPLVWLFFPSLNSYCWHFLLFLISFHPTSSY